MKDLKKACQRVFDRVSKEKIRGELASYIPPLKKVDRNYFAVSLITVEGEEFHFGDYQERFSIQSISKLFVLAKLMSFVKDKSLWKRVGREPSGMAFNSLVQLEMEKGIPRNPFINSGALVTTDMLLTNLGKERALQNILDFIFASSGKHVRVNKEIAKAEQQTGFRNLSMAYLMKSFCNIESEVSDLFELYCNHCAISMSTQDLARASLIFANGGKNLKGDAILLPRQVKRINSILQTCGAYDDAGEIAYRVGLPVKSGVGGGVLAIFPRRFAVTVWSPPLNEHGTSVKGMKFLELLTTELGESVF